MFVISKIVGYLLDPFLWIIILLTIAAFTRDKLRKKILLRLALLFFIFFSNSFVINNIWNSYQAKPVKVKKKYSVGIVLGGMAGYDETLGMGNFNQASDRFIQAARLYKTGVIKKILVTGGNALFVKKTGYNEADFIAQNLREIGVPANDIITEKRSRNTRENASFSKTILDSTGINGPYLLISSAVHIPRARKIFSKQGMDIEGYPCNYQVLPKDTELNFRNFIPTHDAFEKWTLILKEWVGLLVSSRY